MIKELLMQNNGSVTPLPSQLFVLEDDCVPSKVIDLINNAVKAGEQSQEEIFGVSGGQHYFKAGADVILEGCNSSLKDRLSSFTCEVYAFGVLNKVNLFVGVSPQSCRQYFSI